MGDELGGTSLRRVKWFITVKSRSTVICPGPGVFRKACKGDDVGSMFSK